MEGPQRATKKHLIAANSSSVTSRHFFNSNLTPDQKINFFNSGKRFKTTKKLTALRDISNNHIKVYSRVFTNTKLKKTYECKLEKTSKLQYQGAVKHHDCMNTVDNANVTDIKLTNKFQILALLEPDEQGSDSGDNLIRNQKGNTIGNKAESNLSGNTCIRRKQSVDRHNKGGNKQENNVLVNTRIESKPCSDQGSAEKIEGVSLVEGSCYNNVTECIDYHKSADIVKAVIQGKNCLRNVHVNRIMDKCVDLKQCIQQQDTVFGFLPISNLRRLKIGYSAKPNCILSSHNFDPVKTHNVVKATNKCNFEEAKIQLPSNINFKLLEELCKDYWDYQLPLFLKYGFPLDFPVNQETKLISSEVNHSSAVKFPTHVQHYLDTEKQHKAIYGPFKDPPYGDKTQVSPFMTRDKTDSENRRVIIDLSWPQGASINHFTVPNLYLNGVYKLQYPTIDNITDILQEFGTKARLYKIDLSRAFRQLRIDPKDYNLLCLKWQDSYYSDTFCPFGHRSGSMACTRLSDFFRHVMRQRGDVICNYVDDLIGIGTPDRIFNAFQYLKHLLEELGFPISPTKECNCLGVIINTENATISVPRIKIQEMIKKCEKMQQAVVITKKELQSLIGSLMFAHKAVKQTRVFVNRLLQALRDSHKNTVIIINADMKRDLAWLQTFLPVFNGTTKYIHSPIESNETLHIDACLQGVGGVWKRKVYYAKIPQELRDADYLNITHFEMINIIVALNLWAKEWKGKKVLVKTDNMAVVSVCTSGFTRDCHLAAYIRNIWLLTATYDVELIVSHVAGKENNIADLLSRWSNTESDTQKLSQWVTEPHWCIIPESYFRIDYNI